MSDYDLGDTAPVLRVAWKHGISYEAALYAADFMMHQRLPPGGAAALPKLTDVATADLASVAVRFRELAV